MERIGKVQIEHRYEYIDKYVAVQSWPALSAPFILQKIFAARRWWSLAKLFRGRETRERELGHRPLQQDISAGICWSTAGFRVHWGKPWDRSMAKAWSPT